MEHPSVACVPVLLRTVATLLLLAIIIGKGGAHGNTLAAFSPGAAGVSWPLLFGGLAFGMFSFGGSETATALAEECRDPRRDIPRAVIGSVLFCGIFFVIVTSAKGRDGWQLVVWQGRWGR